MAHDLGQERKTFRGAVKNAKLLAALVVPADATFKRRMDGVM